MRRSPILQGRERRATRKASQTQAIFEMVGMWDGGGMNLKV